MELIIFRESREVGRLRLSEGTFSIGRGLHNTIALDDQSISRRHARLHVRDGLVTIQDLSSSNGTLLRGVPVQDSEVQDGDVMGIGPFSLEVHFDDDEDVVYHDQLDRTNPGTDAIPPEVATVTQPVGVSAASPTTPGSAPRGSSSRGRMPVQRAIPMEEMPEDDEEGDEDDDAMHPHDFLGLADDEEFEARPSRPVAPVGGRPAAGEAEKAAPAVAARAAAPAEAPRTRPAPVANSPTIAPVPARPASATKAGASSEGAGPRAAAANSLITGDSSADFVFDDSAIAEEARDDAAKKESPRLPKTFDLASDGPAGAGGARGPARPAVRAALHPPVDADAPRLTVKEGEAVRPVVALPRQTVYIGRAEEMDVVLLDSNASRRHAAVAWENGCFVVRDLWSLNGLKVNGTKTTQARLKSGDLVQIGDTVLEFSWPGEAAAADDEDDGQDVGEATVIQHIPAIAIGAPGAARAFSSASSPTAHVDVSALRGDSRSTGKASLSASPGSAGAGAQASSAKPVALASAAQPSANGAAQAIDKELDDDNGGISILARAGAASLAAAGAGPAGGAGYGALSEPPTLVSRGESLVSPVVQAPAPLPPTDHAAKPTDADKGRDEQGKGPGGKGSKAQTEKGAGAPAGVAAAAPAGAKAGTRKGETAPLAAPVAASSVPAAGPASSQKPVTGSPSGITASPSAPISGSRTGPLVAAGLGLVVLLGFGASRWMSSTPEPVNPLLTGPIVDRHSGPDASAPSTGTAPATGSSSADSGTASQGAVPIGTEAMAQNGAAQTGAAQTGAAQTGESASSPTAGSSATTGSGAGGTAPVAAAPATGSSAAAPATSAVSTGSSAPASGTAPTAVAGPVPTSTTATTAPAATAAKPSTSGTGTGAAAGTTAGAGTAAPTTVASSGARTAAVAPTPPPSSTTKPATSSTAAAPGPSTTAPTTAVASARTTPASSALPVPLPSAGTSRATGTSAAPLPSTAVVNNGRSAGVASPAAAGSTRPGDGAAAPANAAAGRADIEKKMAALYQSGLQAQKGGRYQEAMKLFEAALKGDPGRESELYYQIEDEIEATRSKLYEQVRPIVSEATSLAEAGQLGEARARLQEAISRAPDYQPAVQRLKQVDTELNKQGNRLLANAQSREASGASSEAESLYKQVMALIPDRTHPLYQRAAQGLEQLKQKK